jgi:hypothetical protein
VFPAPPSHPPAVPPVPSEPPPPDPPAAPFEKFTAGPGEPVNLVPPTPPPAEVIVEKTEFDPLVPLLVVGEVGLLKGAAVPPPPTVIGKGDAVIVILFGSFG